MNSQPPVERRKSSDFEFAACIFLLLMVVYHANIFLSFAADATSNVYLSLSMLNDGDMTFTPSETPLLFEWSVTKDGKRIPVHLSAIDASIEKLRESGRLVVDGPRYLIVPSTIEGKYVSTFNPGTSLVALPFFTAMQIFLGDLRTQPMEMWYGSKLVSAACVAGSAVFLFWSVLLYRTRFAAATIALCYGLGTSVWATSSQGLWQHGPTSMFLGAAAYYLIRANCREASSRPALVGFLLGFATFCRPTIGVVVITVGVWYLLRSRREVFAYILGGLPIAILLGLYNYHHLGSPLHFGETLVVNHAIDKTGAAVMFPTPVWYGAAVALISPSRGLLFFSPFLAFSLWGAINVWRQESFSAMRPLTIGVLGIWLSHFTYFDYWGGWTFGNRVLVDTTGLLCLFLTPIWDRLTRSVLLKTVFTTTVAFSIAIQFLGAFAYDLSGWNARVEYEITTPNGVHRTFDAAEAEILASSPNASRRELVLDIDKPENRYRFWSLTDSQIPYYISNFSESFRRRAAISQRFTKPMWEQLAENHARLGQALLEVGDVESAAQNFDDAMQLDPSNDEYRSKLRDMEKLKSPPSAERK